jgi:hypothetical protein
MMAPIYEEIALMQKEIRRMDIISALVSVSLFPLHLADIIVQHLNSQLNYGEWTPFAIVCFPDGSNPTAHPVRALTLLFSKCLT